MLQTGCSAAAPRSAATCSSREHPWLRSLRLGEKPTGQHGPNQLSQSMGRGHRAKKRWQQGRRQQCSQVGHDTSGGDSRAAGALLAHVQMTYGSCCPHQAPSVCVHQTPRASLLLVSSQCHHRVAVLKILVRALLYEQR